MSRLRNSNKNSDSDKGFILGFRLTVDDETPIRLPKGERWTLYFTENFLYIGFGKRTNGEYRYNPTAVLRFRNRYKDSELGVWSVGDDKAPFSSIEQRLSSDLDDNEFSVSSDDDEEEFYDPINGCFYRESDLAERGDCHPVPYRSRESLDRELEEYASQRDSQRAPRTLSSIFPLASMYRNQ